MDFRRLMDSPTSKAVKPEQLLANCLTVICLNITKLSPLALKRFTRIKASLFKGDPITGQDYGFCYGLHTWLTQYGGEQAEKMRDSTWNPDDSEKRRLHYHSLRQRKWGTGFEV